MEKTVIILQEGMGSCHIARNKDHLLDVLKLFTLPHDVESDSPPPLKELILGAVERFGFDRERFADLRMSVVGHLCLKEVNTNWWQGRGLNIDWQQWR